jgi:hypothetical protein
MMPAARSENLARGVYASTFFLASEVVTPKNKTRQTAGSVYRLGGGVVERNFPARSFALATSQVRILS